MSLTRFDPSKAEPLTHIQHVDSMGIAKVVVCYGRATSDISLYIAPCPAAKIQTQNGELFEV